MSQKVNSLDEPVMKFVHHDFPVLREEFTVQQTLDVIRRDGMGERILYFYVTGQDGRLAGVLPTRRLLTSVPDRRLADIMIRRVVAIPQTATVLDACELFVIHRFLAFPVVDDQRRLIGMVEAGLLTEQITSEANDQEERDRVNELFETIGYRLMEVRDASPLKAFKIRFPWLLASIASGSLCAFLTGAYEATLAQSMVLAFFLAMVLGLGESVSMQSMSVTIQRLRGASPSGQWYWQTLRRELGTAALLGLGCGLIVAAIVVCWRGPDMAAVVIGGGIVFSLCSSCVLGLSIPSLLHALKLDPKIAAGPVTLAVADVFTLLFYFNLGMLLLGGN